MKFSIVTPSYNQGRFIEQTLESVLSQGMNLEYLVFDGGSTDETISILERYTGRLSWVSEKDRGQVDAINKGFRRASGEIVAFLNSDDIYYPGALQAVDQYFTANPGVDVLYGDANHIDEQDGVIGPYPTEAFDFERLKLTCFICQPAVFLRRRVLDVCGLPDANLHYALDYEYWIRLHRMGMKFGWLRQVLAGSRLYAENKTLGSRVKMHREINDVIKKHAGQVPDAWVYSYAHAVLDARGVARGSRKFAVLVAGLSVVAALRWNWRITPEMRRTTRQWAGI